MAKGTINKVILIGRLGADPEVRYMPNGTAVANLRLATTDGYKDRNTGQFVEQSEWHRVVLFGRQAEVAGQYLRKGSQVFIEGRLRTNKWQDRNGQDRYTTEVVANEMQLLGSGGGASGMENAGSSSQFSDNARSSFSGSSANQNTPSQKPQSNMPIMEEFNQDFDDDEIPF